MDQITGVTNAVGLNPHGCAQRVLLLAGAGSQDCASGVVSGDRCLALPLLAAIERMLSATEFLAFGNRRELQTIFPSLVTANA